MDRNMIRALCQARYEYTPGCECRFQPRCIHFSVSSTGGTDLMYGILTITDPVVDLDLEGLCDSGPLN